jgi:hypothetical protein
MQPTPRPVTIPSVRVALYAFFMWLLYIAIAFFSPLKDTTCFWGDIKQLQVPITIYQDSLTVFRNHRTTHCSYCSNGLLHNVPCISIWFLPLTRYLSSQSGDNCKGQDVCRYASKHNNSQHPASYESNDQATDEGCQKLYVLPYLNMRSQAFSVIHTQDIPFTCVLNMKDHFGNYTHI